VEKVTLIFLLTFLARLIDFFYYSLITRISLAFLTQAGKAGMKSRSA